MVRYTAIVRPGNESGYVAFIPALKGCVSQGPTREAAVKNIHEAAQAYVDALVEDGMPLPREVEVQSIDVEGTFTCHEVLVKYLTVDEAIDTINEIAKGKSLGGLTIGQLIEEGTRF